MKHTSGKWYFEQDGSAPYVVCNNYHLGRICTMEGSDREATGNAYLAASAPDLQRCLHNLLNYLLENQILTDDLEKLTKIMDLSEKALRKSKGL